MKIIKQLTYILITLFLLQLYRQIAFAETYTIPAELQKKQDITQTYSLWLGGAFGALFSSDDIHNYLKEHVRNDPLSLYFSLSAKACFQVAPVSWLNLQTVADLGSGVNYSGNLLRKHSLTRLGAGILPGFAFNSDDSRYMLHAGPFMHYYLFHDETDYGIGYRLKLTIIPFVNGLIDFPTVRGTIAFDYAYGSNNDFQLGYWGFQIGFEILAW